MILGTKKARKLLSRSILVLLVSVSFSVPLEAQAVPGLSSSESVKKIVDMIKVYAKRNQRVNTYDIEKQLRDRPRAATDALVDLLDTNDSKVKLETARVLQRLSSHNDYSISDQSLKTLIAILGASESPSVRATLLSVLGNIGPKNESVKQAILETINGDFEVKSKRAAIESLAKLSMQEKPQYHAASSEVLIKILKTSDAPVLRSAAASALSRYHSDARIAVPALVAALDDNYLKVRSAAVQALGRYKVGASQSVAPLLKALETESNIGIRNNCLYALKSVGVDDKRVVEKFIELLDDDTVKGNVISYLYYFGYRAAPAVPKLIVVLKGSDKYQRRNACRALGAMGEKAKDALPALKALTSDPDTSVAGYAKSAINRIKNNNVSSGRM